MNTVKHRATDASTTGCGHENPLGYQFCDACGAKLPRCPQCLRPNREGARFCGYCSATLTGVLIGAAARLDMAAQGEEARDDASERLARILEHRARVQQARRSWLGLMASAIAVLAVLGLVSAWLWVGPRASGPRTATNGAAGIGDQRETDSPAPAESGRASAPDEASAPDDEKSVPPPSSVATGRPAAGLSDGSPARGGSVEPMAEYLVANLGSAQAEARALQNAEWYAPGSADFAYWQRVAAAIRRTKPAAR